MKPHYNESMLCYNYLSVLLRVLTNLTVNVIINNFFRFIKIIIVFMGL